MHTLVKWRRKILIRTIFEDWVLAFTWILIIFYATQVLPIPSYVWIIPLVISFLSKFLLQSWPKSPCEGSIHLLSIMGNICRIIILAFVLGKIENLINWAWGGILWGWWLTFTILVIITLFWCILFLNSVFSFFQDEVGYQAIAGSFWCVILFGGYTTTNFISTLYIIWMFENKSVDDSNLKIFTNLFLPNLIFIIVSIISTIVFWKPLVPWWDYFLYGEDPIEIQEENGEGQDGEQNRERRVKTVQISTPIFLKRISSTLFTKSKKRDRKKIEAKLKRREEQKNTKSETETKTVK